MGAIVRRAIISLGVAVALFLAVPLAVPATQVGVARVAILSDQFLMGPLTPSWLEAFRGGLNDLGWSEGRNLTIDIREVENPEQRPRIVADLLHRNPSVIVTTPPGARIIAPHVRDPKLPGWTPVTSIPIVFAWYSDPVGAGLVTSLARPGGNVTGLAYLGIELNAKRLELLKEAFPTLKRVGVLVPVDHPLEKRMVAEVEAAARTLKIEPRFAGARLSDPSVKIDEAVESLARERVEAILGLQGPHYGRERQRIAELTLKHRLPGIFEIAEYAEAGCLMAYAPSITGMLRQAAGYTDKILRGAKPSELPVEQPTRFEFVINMRTARTLGIAIPPSVLLRADRVIQ